MSWVNAPRDVRVTARKATPQDFIAAELSGVGTHNLEMDKGIPGWTDLDVKVEDLTGTHVPAGLAERQLEEMKVGTYVPRKASDRKVRVLNPTGPNSYHKAMKARAAKLAAC
ncbi:hypothetical protein SEA_ZIMMER_91 [Mycobacterium phage Zimmer]|nr:hypothetical protein SEA_ZIMMER_91 [Mycobacterium phage Zimmer]